MVTLKKKYVDEVRARVMQTRGLPNIMQAPRLLKIVVNMGIGCGVDKDVFKSHVAELGRICGQKPLVTRASKSISNFKLREGMDIGACVTLRGDRMYEFLERLICATLPRIRDFRGIPARGFDRRGNYTLGIKEQGIFPEIDPDHVKRTQGMDITFVTSAKSDDDARELLTLLGMPFAQS